MADLRDEGRGVTLLVLALPYLAIMVWCWDRKRTPAGVVACVTLLVLELIVAAHFWVAGVL